MNSYRCAIIITALVMSVVAAPQPTYAEDQDIQSCGSPAQDPDARIEACTRALNSLNVDLGYWARRLAITFSLRGWAWEAKGDPNRAVADFAEAIRIDPGYAPAYEARGNVYRDLDRCPEALSDYDQAIRLQPERVPAYVRRAVCLIDTNQAERAGADLDQAIKLDVDNAGGYAVLALSMKARLGMARGDLDGAMTNFDAAIKLAPQDAALYLDRGAVWSGKGDGDRALADYDQAIKFDGNNTGGFAITGRLLKARLQAGKGNFDAAISEYDEALKLDPKRVALYVDRAGVWNLKGDENRALTNLDEAVKADSASAFAYNSRGDFYRNRGDYAQALTNYDQAIQNQPDELAGYSNRALVRFYQGDFAKAADDLKRVSEGRPTNAYPMLLIYLSKTRAGRKEARDELTNAAEKLEKDQWPYPLIELFIGRKSLQATEAAAKTPEQRCEAQFYIGQWHLTRDAKPAALKALQTAVDSCPKDFVEYRGAVEELKRLAR